MNVGLLLSDNIKKRKDEAVLERQKLVEGLLAINEEIALLDTLLAVKPMLKEAPDVVQPGQRTGG